MYPVVISIHVLVCLLVILVVMIQSGKGAGLSGLTGGGSSDALFNAPSGSMFMRKVTAGLVILFFATSLLLTFLASRQRVQSVIQSPSAAPFDASLPPAEGLAGEETSPVETAAPAENK
jgi:preprotein translocase subunit SecG